VRLTSSTAVKSPKRRVRPVVETAELMWLKHILEAIAAGGEVDSIPVKKLGGDV
jgi:hypothetical protein